MGGIWAEISLRYDESFIFKAQNRPFFVDSIRPVQLSNRNSSSSSRVEDASTAING
jgi:hypothetical protein